MKYQGINRTSKKSIAFLIVVMTLIMAACGDGNDVGPGSSWVRKANYPGSFYYDAPSFVIDQKAYVLAGKKLWEYDKTSDKWTQRKSIPSTSGDKDKAFAFAIGQKGYVGCGGQLVQSKDFWVYDPATDTWTQKLDFPGVKRYGSATFVINNKAYVVSGDNIYGGYSYLKEVWEYDAVQDKWTQKSDMSGPGRTNGVSFAIGSKGYIGTGYNPYETPVILNDFYEYDPSTDKWTRKNDFPGTERYTAVGFAVGTKGYLATGFNGPNKIFKDVWEYNPSSDMWKQIGEVGTTERYDAVSFVIGNTAYIGGGTGSEYDIVKDDSGFDHANEYLWAHAF